MKDRIPECSMRQERGLQLLWSVQKQESSSLCLCWAPLVFLDTPPCRFPPLPSSWNTPDALPGRSWSQRAHKADQEPNWQLAGVPGIRCPLRKSGCGWARVPTDLKEVCVSQGPGGSVAHSASLLSTTTRLSFLLPARPSPRGGFRDHLPD